MSCKKKFKTAAPNSGHKAITSWWKRNEISGPAEMVSESWGHRSTHTWCLLACKTCSWNDKIIKYTRYKQQGQKWWTPNPGKVSEITINCSGLKLSHHSQVWMYVTIVPFAEAAQAKAAEKAFGWELSRLQRDTRSPLGLDQSALWAGQMRSWANGSSVCVGVRCERFLPEDRSGGRLQPSSGNHPAGRRPVHQDLHQCSHDKRLLHRRPVLQRDHGGRACLYGTYLMTYQLCLISWRLGRFFFSDSSLRVRLCCCVALTLQSFPKWEKDNKISCEQTLQKGDGPKTGWTRELTNDGELILVLLLS